MIKVEKIMVNGSFVPDIPEGSVFEFCTLDDSGQFYLVDGVTLWGNSPFTISQLQGKLQLDLMGLFAQVEAMIEQSGSQAKIYWNTAANWERNSPILARLAPMIWPDDTEAKLDEFFINAKKLN